MNKEKPFMTAGMLTTIKSRGNRFSITCPECSFIFFATYHPGSCQSIYCTECSAVFMGIVYQIDCGECEKRLKCFGMRPVPFIKIPENAPPIKISLANTMMLADCHFQIQELLKDPNLFKGISVGVNTK